MTAMRYVRRWPNAPIDEQGLSGRFRGEADGRLRRADDREGSIVFAANSGAYADEALDSLSVRVARQLAIEYPHHRLEE
jgi:hypothetical protein